MRVNTISPSALNSIPVFNPSDDNPRQWINIIERLARVYGWTADQKVDVAKCRLSGIAQTWDEGTGHQTTTWDLFTKAFLERFAVSEEDMLQQLSSCRQGKNELVRSYADRYRHLLAQLGLLSPDDEHGTQDKAHKSNFIRGLTKNIRERLHLMLPHDLEDAIKKATYISQALEGENNTEEPPVVLPERRVRFETTDMKPARPTEERRYEKESHPPRYGGNGGPHWRRDDRPSRPQQLPASAPRPTVAQTTVEPESIASLTRQLKNLTLSLQQADPALRPAINHLRVDDSWDPGVNMLEQVWDAEDDAHAHEACGSQYYASGNDPAWYSTKRVSDFEPMRPPAKRVPIQPMRSTPMDADGPPNRPSPQRPTFGARPGAVPGGPPAPQGNWEPGPMTRVEAAAAGPRVRTAVEGREREPERPRRAVGGAATRTDPVPAEVTDQESRLGEEVFARVCKTPVPLGLAARVNIPNVIAKVAGKLIGVARQHGSQAAARQPSANLYDRTTAGPAAHHWERDTYRAVVEEVEPEQPRFQVCKTLVHILLNDGYHYPLTAVVDSGASNSVITMDAIRRMGLMDNIEETGVSFLNADGVKGKARGMIRDLPICLPNLVFPTTWYISNAKSYSALIGTDILYSLQACLDLKGRTLTYTDDNNARSRVYISCLRAPQEPAFHADVVHVEAEQPSVLLLEDSGEPELQEWPCTAGPPSAVESENKEDPMSKAIGEFMQASVGRLEVHPKKARELYLTMEVTGPGDEDSSRPQTLRATCKEERTPVPQGWPEDPDDNSPGLLLETYMHMEGVKEPLAPRTRRLPPGASPFAAGTVPTPQRPTEGLPLPNHLKVAPSRPNSTGSRDRVNGAAVPRTAGEPHPSGMGRVASQRPLADLGRVIPDADLPTQGNGGPNQAITEAAFPAESPPQIMAPGTMAVKWVPLAVLPKGHPTKNRKPQGSMATSTVAREYLSELGRKDRFFTVLTLSVEEDAPGADPGAAGPRGNKRPGPSGRTEARGDKRVMHEAPVTGPARKPYDDEGAGPSRPPVAEPNPQAAAGKAQRSRKPNPKYLDGVDGPGGEDGEEPDEGSRDTIACQACGRSANARELVPCDYPAVPAHGKHIGCMRPPLAKVPRGRWYCDDHGPLFKVQGRQWRSPGRQSEGAEKELSPLLSSDATTVTDNKDAWTSAQERSDNEDDRGSEAELTDEGEREKESARTAEEIPESKVWADTKLLEYLCTTGSANPVVTSQRVKRRAATWDWCNSRLYKLRKNGRAVEVPRRHDWERAIHSRSRIRPQASTGVSTALALLGQNLLLERRADPEWDGAAEVALEQGIDCERFKEHQATLQRAAEKMDGHLRKAQEQHKQDYAKRHHVKYGQAAGAQRPEPRAAAGANRDPRPAAINPAAVTGSAPRANEVVNLVSDHEDGSGEEAFRTPPRQVLQTPREAPRAPVKGRAAVRVVPPVREVEDPQLDHLPDLQEGQLIYRALPKRKNTSQPRQEGPYAFISWDHYGKHVLCRGGAQAVFTFPVKLLRLSADPNRLVDRSALGQ